MGKKLRKFLKMTPEERCLFNEAVALVFLAKTLLSFLPFKRVMEISLWRPADRTGGDQASLCNIKRALRLADKLAFWKNRCLVQSIAGKWMLQRRGINSQISFGLRFDASRRLIAHAWLKAGEIELVEKGDDYYELTAL